MLLAHTFSFLSLHYPRRNLFSLALAENSAALTCDAERAERRRGLYLPSRAYACKSANDEECFEASSVLCDFKADCPDADDEKEDFCGKKGDTLLSSIKTAIFILPAKRKGCQFLALSRSSVMRIFFIVR